MFYQWKVFYCFILLFFYISVTYVAVVLSVRELHWNIWSSVLHLFNAWMMHFKYLCVLTGTMFVDIASFLTWSLNLVPTWAFLTYIQLVWSASFCNMNNWNELTQIVLSYFFFKARKWLKHPLAFRGCFQSLFFSFYLHCQMLAKGTNIQ